MPISAQFKPLALVTYAGDVRQGTGGDQETFIFRGPSSTPAGSSLLGAIKQAQAGIAASGNYNALSVLQGAKGAFELTPTLAMMGAEYPSGNPVPLSIPGMAQISQVVDPAFIALITKSGVLMAPPAV